MINKEDIIYKSINFMILYGEKTRFEKYNVVSCEKSRFADLKFFQKHKLSQKIPKNDTVFAWGKVNFQKSY